MKNLFKVFIMVILVLSFFSFNSSNVEAAKPKIAHVNIKSGTLNVRSGASEKAKKVGSLKKDTGVYVYSKTKSGWSEIRYKKKKAYVATKYLKFANSYLQDKKKVYTFMANGKKYKEVYSKSYDGWDEWVSNGKDTYIVREDKNGLYLGVYDGGYSIDIKYPIKVGNTWGASDNGDIARIISVSKTVKTPAGTFKNCIEVTYTYDDGDVYIMYFAKNVGFVKTVHKGITISQLIKLENK